MTVETIVDKVNCLHHILIQKITVGDSTKESAHMGHAAIMSIDAISVIASGMAFLVVERC